MPTEVFNSLSEAKKQKLIEAAYKSFIDKPSQLVSINEISKNLGITRTAFYYYFSSKEDIYQYIVNLEKEKFLNNYVHNSTQKLDLFEIFILLFEFLSTYKDSPKKSFFIDLFYNIRYDDQNELLSEFMDSYKLSQLTHFKGFDNLIDMSKEEMNEMIRLIFGLVYHEILIYYKKDISFKEAKKALEKKMDFIKHGIIKKEGYLNA